MLKLRDRGEKTMGIENEFTKYELYQILSTKSELAYHLPPAGLFNDFEDVLKFIEANKKVVLKPVDSSSRNRIFIVEKCESDFKITDYRRKRQIRMSMYNVDELREFFKSTENKLDKYIIQKQIKSIRIEQAGFDLRVVMKRGLKGDWRCGELEYKVGGNNFLLTNVERDVYPAALGEVMKKTYPLKFDFIKSIKKVRKLCETTCETISGIIEQDNDIEFEVAIDEDNKLWFVDINLSECLKKFKAVDYNTYFSARGTALLYNK
jgi:hypothetical protein